MKRVIVTTTLLAFALSAASPLFAADTAAQKSAEAACKAQAEKEHVAKDKLDAYMKSCIQKHAQAATTPGGTPAQPATKVQ